MPQRKRSHVGPTKPSCRLPGCEGAKHVNNNDGDTDNDAQKIIDDLCSQAANKQSRLNELLKEDEDDHRQRDMQPDVRHGSDSYCSERWDLIEKLGREIKQLWYAAAKKDGRGRESLEMLWHKIISMAVPYH